MNNPQLYGQVNLMQKLDSLQFLQEYVHLIKWKRDKEERVMDVGCGTGNVTFEVLKNMLPAHVRKIVAVDKNENMIRKACSDYSDPKIEFQILDLAENLSGELTGQFGHIFSFFCLHWIHDQKTLMKNLHDLLRPNGSLLFLMVHRCEQVDTNYEKLASDSRWKKYMTDVKDYVLPYRHETNPEKSLRDLMETTGFAVKTCHLMKKKYTFLNDTQLAAFLESINPFIDRMPLDEKRAYLADYIKLFKEMDPDKYGEATTKHYTLFYVHAERKKTPLNN